MVVVTMTAQHHAFRIDSDAADSVMPGAAAERLEHWGFLARPDLPDAPGPALLLVALRRHPTLRHYDPELVRYWVTVGGQGRPVSITHATPVPIDQAFSWGMMRLVDRLGVTNEYLTFGGRLQADFVGDALVAVFMSPAPLLRRGGHSQGWDAAASELGAFFGRQLLAVDLAPGFEAAAAAADPVARYAAFVADAAARYRRSEVLRSTRADVCRLIVAEERRLREHCPAAWAAGTALLAQARHAG